MRLELDEARRLTGPNLLWDKPGAILDVFIDDIDKNKVVNVWQRWVATLLTKFGWQQPTTYRLHRDGANLALSAPMDALYCACDLAELAWHCAVAELKNDSAPDWQQRLNELHKELAEELNPGLITLMNEANKRGVSCISDDDDVSLSNENLLVEVKGARMLDTDDLCLSRTTYAKHEVDMLNGTKK